MAPAAFDPAPDPLTREIERSRRYRHPLTLLRVAPGPSVPARLAGVRSLGHRRREPVDALAEVLSSCLRTGDVTWSDGAALFVLLPETDASGADAMLARFRRAAPGLADDTDVRVASFPEHGLTHHALRTLVAQRRRTAAPSTSSSWRLPYVAGRRPLRRER